MKKSLFFIPKERDIYFPGTLSDLFRFCNAETRKDKRKLLDHLERLHADLKSQKFPKKLADDLEVFGIVAYASEEEALTCFFKKFIPDVKKGIRECGSPLSYIRRIKQGGIYRPNMKNFSDTSFMRAWRNLHVLAN